MVCSLSVCLVFSEMSTGFQVIIQSVAQIIQPIVQESGADVRMRLHFERKRFMRAGIIGLCLIDGFNLTDASCLFSFLVDCDAGMATKQVKLLFTCYKTGFIICCTHKFSE